ncbi:DDE transposase [Streptococcus azizii]|uniref:DDE transposase n=1 Tax=Streptococcus azizii TaxID=1579424 RepID=A0AB36JNJ5_9STRE|nr:IS1182 family transposase [Streptococcus sp. 19428wD3_AN2]ONK26887.1 DDE transposase [Streptococcus azizii]ONK27909.1 DDE transposase [Streptococcus azizii]ONK28753.1 DDE transposase [Streptococcus azizii]TFU83457.1 IS1182 family transposase [Streptococcus sp. AN2]
MFHKDNPELNRNQVGFYTLDELVPQDHLLRLVDRHVDFNFIYDLVQDSYSHETGRPSLDPVLLIKIPLIQCLYGIRSMRQTIKEIEVNVAYRWFLGLSLGDRVPHFTTYGKNYQRRFKDRYLIERIFDHILGLCLKAGLIDPSEMFVDGTHIKAAANNHKYTRQEVQVQAKFMAEQLEIEVNRDREKHGKKSLKPAAEEEPVEKKMSTTDPESGWFHKGEHKEVFAYSAQVACDKHGWALAYTVEAGNIHDSQAFPVLWAKLKPFSPDYLVADSGYKTPTIAKFLLDQEVTPVFPYTRPRGKKEKLRPKDFVYDDYYDVYICPENQLLDYRTTTRGGYREYKSDAKKCASCPLLSICTESQNHQRTITRHIWRDYLEVCEDIRHQRGMRALYQKRKETIERLFGTAKEYHNLRYTRERGKSKMEDKVGLTLACLNLKKYVKMMAGKAFCFALKVEIFKEMARFHQNTKRQTTRRNGLSSI